jgi:hypothetical protein
LQGEQAKSQEYDKGIFHIATFYKRNVP